MYEIRHRYANAHLFYSTPWLTISAKQTTRILNFYQTTKHTTSDAKSASFENVNERIPF